ncbi:MAG: glycosyltransferase [Proteobacteria bacterium]|nr:glycosyltransferase [Pseudomonadota bacterium]MBU1715662.1 glycosyltransferase [Pseudomonadota bacterium]
MSDNFSVSLVIPCFNAEIFIKPVIDSVLQQTRKPDEIIVIDDGSIDNTRKLVGQFPGVRLIAHPTNLGIAAARNTAIAQAQGEIIVFLDADAIAAPVYIEEIIAPFSRQNVAGVNGRALEVVQKNIYDKWRREVLFQEWGDNFRAEVFFLFGMCAAYRKEALAQVGGFDELFRTSGEDMDISFRLRKLGYLLAYNPEALVYHQRQDSAQTIKKMTFRHCFWGFLAQKKNKCFQNKLTVWQSAFVLVRQLFYDGLLKGNLRFALLSLQLHAVIGRAWLAARRTDLAAAAAETGKVGHHNYEWEGHGKK